MVLGKERFAFHNPNASVLVSLKFTNFYILQSSILLNPSINYIHSTSENLVKVITTFSMAYQKKKKNVEEDPASQTCNEGFLTGWWRTSKTALTPSAFNSCSSQEDLEAPHNNAKTNTHQKACNHFVSRDNYHKEQQFSVFQHTFLI